MVNLIILFLGVILLILNIIGLFRSKRKAWINEFYQERKPTPFKETINQLKKKESESFLNYMNRANEVIYHGVAHPVSKSGRKYFYFSIFENYIFYFLRIFFPKKFSILQPNNPLHILEHGVGKCEAKAKTLWFFLRRENIPTKIILLQGHVVISAKDENFQWHTLDPDRGVSIPIEIHQLAHNTNQIENAYRERKNTSESKIKILKEIYAKGPLKTAKNIKEFKGNKHYLFISMGEIFKWIIPISFVSISISIHLK